MGKPVYQGSRNVNGVSHDIFCLFFLDLQPSLLSRLKPIFHYPSWRPGWRPELTGVKKCTRVDGPPTRVHFLTPVNSGLQLGCQKMHPSSRAVNSARELGPWTRVVETELYSGPTFRFFSPGLLITVRFSLSNFTLIDLGGVDLRPINREHLKFYQYNCS